MGLWANILKVILKGNLMFHMLHMLAHNLTHIMPHTLKMLMIHMLIMHKHINDFYMLRCTHAHIVAEKVTWLNFVMIELILLMIMFGFKSLTL